ncbi:MerR family transcriptional regulator [Lysinibacillus xylanilyticus]|uniref:MerR family transcriptional regulator n=1 Tax=Lysinibacillus xylanilyticus TaxID=582475 RepID=UPI002B251C80|nr:MerR family transcriptional regulator [Lysinibacillus xylanilyticus]MEB2281935.1 MerR family transcriptional regulator [Lysinibacillus xylanilyticus]
MNKDKKFSIGEFSEKTGMPIPTLHYYDEIGLLQPEKNPSTGHRTYYFQDIITLQKIISLKFLGYRLDKIAILLNESSFYVDLNESLSLHLNALVSEKKKIEQSIQAIKRVIKLLEEEGEVDSTILFSLIYNMKVEHKHEEWMKRHRLTDITEELSIKSGEDKTILDKTFIQFSKEMKQLYGKPIDDSKVQEMVKNYLDFIFSFLGDDLIQKLADTNLEELDIQELENMTTSPFTEDEQKWFNQALEFYMKQGEME